MDQYQIDVAVLSQKKPVNKRTHLFLQGPVGPFFKELAKAFKDKGDNIYRIHSNTGDVIDWLGMSDAVSYRGRSSNWPNYIQCFLLEKNITDLYVYGDCRPLHKEAITIAKKLNVNVHVFEEGYIRPNYVTYETDGVNANSPMPKEADYYTHHPIIVNNKDIPTPIPVPPAGSNTGWYAFRYYLACIIGCIGFPFYKTHRHWSHINEAYSWVIRSFTYFKRKQRAFQIQKTLYQKREKYYLCLLQLTGDSQIQKHSAYRCMREYIRDVIQSFAKNAPLNTKLVFKNHPLDNGIGRLEKKTMRLARRYGVEERVFFVDGGRLRGLAQIARGVITVNSTAAFSALHCLKPTIALGQAVYNMRGLTYRGTLNDFWKSNQKPDEELYKAFRKVLTHTSQRNGNFFNKEGRGVLIMDLVKNPAAKPISYPYTSAANNNELIAAE